MELAAQELLRSIRGSRSQVAFARRLGYRGNPITDWERGERFPTAEETLRAASLSKIDVEAAFQRFSGSVALRRAGRGFALAAWLSALRGGASTSEIARRAGFSRDSVGRWLRGDAKPRLPEFLRLLDAITGRTADWVAELVPIESVPSLESTYRAAAAAKRLAFELPWTEAVLRVLETRDCQLSTEPADVVVARALGLAREAAQQYLDALVLAGAVEFTSDQYRVSTTSAVDTQGGKQALLELKRHWCRVAEQRLLDQRAADLFAYNVVSVSRDDLLLIREKLRATFREIRALVATSRPEEVVGVINLQLVSFEP